MQPERLSMSLPRKVGTSAVVLATAATVLVATPPAIAWQTRYDRTADTCTITFTPRDQQRVNAAYRTLFTEMVTQTDNTVLQTSFTEAANRPFFGEGTDTLHMSPQQAREHGGVLYGVDVAKLVMPFGIEAAINNIGIENIISNVDLEAALSEVDFHAVVKAIDFKAAVGDVDTAKALKSLPLKEVLENMDWSQVEPTPQELRGLVDFKINPRNIPSYIPLLGKPTELIARMLKDSGLDARSVVKKLTSGKEAQISAMVEQALRDADLDTEQVLGDAIAAAGIDTEQVLKNVLAQDAVKQELNAQLKKVNFLTLFKDAVEKSGVEFSVEALLGYKVSDLTTAGSDAIDAVGPRVLAPIATMNDAFTACAEANEPGAGSTVGSTGRRSSSSPDTVNGSVAKGSSLSMDGLKIVSILGAIATLLFSGAIGYAARPALDQFIASMLR